MLRKPVCAKCETSYKPEENGVYVAEMYQKNTSIYKLWCGDLWKCPVCSHEIVIGFGNPTHCSDENLEAKVIELKEKGRTIIYDNERIM